LAFDGQGSWLSSDQQSLSGSQPFALDGILFNPPHFRARAGATYRANAFTAAAFVNYIGPVTDNRAAPAVKGESMTTADLTLMYRPDAQFPLLRDVDLSLSVNNVTNEAPPLLRSLGLTYVNYDSTNYSPVGRYVSLFASKHW
jgi:outer membrane receptor protein involved in Fe transport